MWCIQCCHRLGHRYSAVPEEVLGVRRELEGLYGRHDALLSVLAETLCPRWCRPHHGRRCWTPQSHDRLWPPRKASPHHGSESRPFYDLLHLNTQYGFINTDVQSITNNVRPTLLLKFKILFENRSKTVPFQQSHFLDHFFPVGWDIL